METVLNMVIDPDNVRMVLMVVLGFSGFVLISSKMSRMEFSLKGQISELRGELKGEINDLRGELNELKHNDITHLNNDIAHLNSTIEALTFTLEKNGFLKREDKEYIDSRLNK